MRLMDKNEKKICCQNVVQFASRGLRVRLRAQAGYENLSGITGSSGTLENSSSIFSSTTWETSPMKRTDSSLAVSKFIVKPPTWPASTSIPLKSSEITPRSPSISGTYGVMDDLRFFTTAIEGVKIMTRSPKSDADDNFDMSFSRAREVRRRALESCLALASSEESKVQCWVLFSFMETINFLKISLSLGLFILWSSSRRLDRKSVV